MPALALDKETAIWEVANVENALFDGHPPPGSIVKGAHEKTAVRIAAERMGIPPQTINNHTGKPSHQGVIERVFGFRVDWSMWRQQDFTPIKDDSRQRLGGTGIDRKLIELKDEVTRLNNALREAHRAALDDDAVRTILGTLEREPAKPPLWLTIKKRKSKDKPTQEVPVTIWADWHVGESVEPTEVNGFNAYNLKIAEERVHRLVESTINICLKHGPKSYPGIVVNLLGDFVSGGIHPELAKTDEEEVIPAVLRVRDLLVWALKRIADVFGKVYCPCTSGNHGRNTVKPEFKRYQYKNFDWLIYQLLIRHFADVKDKRVQFDIRPSNDVLYRVFNIGYLAVHGDMLGVKGGDGIIGSIGPITRGEFKKARQQAGMGSDYDVLLMGHYHQSLCLPRIIVANTIKGFDEYARLQLGAMPTEPSQPLWFVHPIYGRTSYWEIRVDEPRVQSAEWVSWSK